MRGQLRLVAWLAVKDWRLFLSDRRAALMCFAIPVILASGFGAVFKRPTSSSGAVRLPVTLVVEDDAPLTRRVVEDLRKSDRLEITLADRRGAERSVRRRGSGVVLVMPSGFGRLAPGAPRTPAVELLHGPTAVAEAQWAEGVLTEVVMRRLAADWLAAAPGGGAESLLRRPFDVRRQPIGGAPNSSFDSYSHSFCGMTLQYLLFWGMDSGLLLLQERRRGLWFRLRAAPIAWPALIAGKCLATSVVALLMVAVTFGIGAAFFGVRVTGSPLGFLTLAAAAALVSSATGLFVATLGGTEAQTRNLSIVAILGVSLLGGLWLPSFLLPEWVRSASLALPTTWAARGLNGVTWQGMGTWESLGCAAVVAAYGVTFLGLAALRFARMESALRQGAGT